MLRFGSGQAPHGAIHLHNWNVCAAACARATSASPRATSPATGPRPTWPTCCRCCWSTASTCRTSSTALGRAPAVPPAPPAAPQQQGRQPEEHPRPLRPGQRVLRVVAGPDDELFVGLVRRRPWPADARGAARQGAARAAHGGRAARRPRAGDRLRLGRAGGNGGHRVRRRRHRHHAVDRAAGLRAGPHGARRRGPPGRPAAAGLPRRVRRSLRRVCSIEMVEAVGREYWPGYFATSRACSSRVARPASRAS
jgi:hypothetical protein